MLIVVEGIDGSGKTSLVREVSTLLCRKMYPQVSVSSWSVPGGVNGTMLGNQVRKILEESSTGLTEVSKALLLAADHHNIHKLIKIAGDSSIIILDRFYPSLFAYQGAKGVDKDWLKRIVEPIPLTPVDLFIYMDIPIEIAIKRFSSRGRGADRIESRYSSEYLNLVAYNYRNFMEGIPLEQKMIVDATQEPDVIVQAVMERIQEIICDKISEGSLKVGGEATR